MILLEMIKFLVALIVIALLLVVLVAIVMAGWEVLKKSEQKNQK